MTRTRRRVRRRAHGLRSELLPVPTNAEVLAILGPDPASSRGVVCLESGTVVVVDDNCPHDGGLISDGHVEGELLACVRHGGQLRACSGRCERARHSELHRSEQPRGSFVIDLFCVRTAAVVMNT